MYGPNLSPSVEVGLAWYYWLVALLNVGAALHWTYWSRGKQATGMVCWALVASGALFGVMSVGKLLGMPAEVLYYIAIAGSLLSAGASVYGAVQATVKPAIMWGVAAIIFQLLGLTYVLGAELAMTEGMKALVDYIAGPVTFFVSSTIAFILVLVFRSFFASPLVIWIILDICLLFFGFAMTDYDFRLIVAKPDNVPITIMLFLVGFFSWLSLRRAVINDKRISQGLRPIEAEESDKVLVWPDLVYTEMLVMIVCTVILVLWSILLQAPLEEWANLNKTPNPSKAPWYFLGLQEMLVYYDPWLAGVVFPGLIIVGLMAIPYIDFNRLGSGYYTFNQRSFSIVVFLFGFIILWVLMVVLGTFLRGPGWNFFGPYQYWDPHLVLPLTNVDLSDYFWVKMLGQGKPKSFMVREMPGFIAVAGYLLILPPLLAKTVFREFFIKLGFARYMVFSFLFLGMAALPIKMVLRWTINLKYIVHIDEFFFNI